jgi:2-oxoglutarate ferredoxin oxidoreductase subunit beta
MHSTVCKLIGEVVEELHIEDRVAVVLGVGCDGLAMSYLTFDNTTSPHGRACAVANGVKKSSPETIVFTYQGDGDLGSIGLGETVSSANRGDNITVIFVNNGIYGMTGGQMAPTTLLGMKATTAPQGRKAELHGYPLHMCELLDALTAPVYLERVSCNTAANVIKTRKAMKKAFQNQIDGKGFSLVEIVTTCPTNWGLSTLDALTFLEEEMFKEYPLGVIRDKTADAGTGAGTGADAAKTEGGK